jgi:hypothetical protein
MKIVEGKDEGNEDLGILPSDVNWTMLIRIIRKDKECMQNSGVDTAWKLSVGRQKNWEDNFMAVLWEKGSKDCTC